MPILNNAKTVEVIGEPWKSPDGKVKIWTIKLEIDGERNTHSTMSEKIATVGWAGDIEVYTNAKGKDYVRQAPKEDFGGTASSSSPTKPAYQPSPEQQESIARSVALKASVDFCSPVGSNMSVDDVLSTADTFLAWLQGGQGSSESTNPKAMTTPMTTQTSSASTNERRDERDEYNDMRNQYDEPPIEDDPRYQ